MQRLDWARGYLVQSCVELKVHRGGMQFARSHWIGRLWLQRAFEHNRAVRCGWLWPRIRLPERLSQSTRSAVALLRRWRTYVGPDGAAVTAPDGPPLISSRFRPILAALINNKDTCFLHFLLPWSETLPCFSEPDKLRRPPLQSIS